MDETAFIGKITASATHEFMNVLATIRESSGLMEDLLVLSKEPVFPHKEKFLKIARSIQEQVKRGMEISERLNQFAHSMDEPKKQIEINEILSQLAFLMQRFAALKGVQLQVHPTSPPLIIWIDPFRLQLILSVCLEFCFEHSAHGSVIRLQSQKKEGKITIQSVMDKRDNLMRDTVTLPGELSRLQETLNRLDGQLLLINTPGLTGLELILPNKTE